MRYNLISRFRKKLKLKKPLIGTWIQSGSCINAEILAKNGYDWIAIDMEHGQIDWKTHQDLIRVIESCNVIPLTRVSQPNVNDIKHALDSGSYGIIIPNMKNFQEVDNILNYSKFPPAGKRGVGFCRANNFGKDFNQYMKNFKPILIPMLENLNFFGNLDKIIKIKDIDVIFLGPYDFSASINQTGKFNSKKFKDYEKKFLDNLRFHKIKPGIHLVSPNQKDLKKLISKGYRFIALSTDTQFLSKASEINVKI